MLWQFALLPLCLSLLHGTASVAQDQQPPVAQGSATQGTGDPATSPAKQPSQGNFLMGDAKIKILTSYTGPAPLLKPRRITVLPFTVPADAITVDNSLAERMHEHHEERHGNGDASSPEALAEEVNALFSKTLVEALQSTQIPTREEAAAGSAEEDSMVVSGEFTAVNQGNRAKRIVIGLGRGASDVQAHVTVSAETRGGKVVMSEFTLNSSSGKKPGAAETAGVGGVAVSAAVGDVGDKKATVEADVKRMAQAVAKEVTQVMVAQHWIPAATK